MRRVSDIKLIRTDTCSLFSPGVALQATPDHKNDQGSSLSSPSKAANQPIWDRHSTTMAT